MTWRPSQLQVHLSKTNPPKKTEAKFLTLRSKRSGRKSTTRVWLGNPREARAKMQAR